MTLFDMKKIRESLSKSAGGIKKSFSAAAEKLPDAAKSINLTDSMKDMAEKSQTMVDALKAKSEEMAVSRKETADEAKIAIDSAMADQKRSEALFSVRDALRIMYCLCHCRRGVKIQRDRQGLRPGLRHIQKAADRRVCFCGSD